MTNDQSDLDDSRPDVPPIRRGLAVLSVVVGIVILVIAWHFSADENPLGLVLNPFGVTVDVANATFLSGLLVNIGTTVLLAVILIVFERSILRRVRTANKESEQRAKRVAERKVEEAVTKRIVPLETRLTDLDSLFRSHGDAKARERRDAAARILDNPDFDSFSEKLSAIAASGAVTKPWGNVPDDAALFIVPAGDDLSAPRVTITYSGDDGRKARDVMFAVMYAAEGDVMFNWNKAVSLDDVLRALNDELVRRGGVHVSKRFSADSLFRNVRSFLEAATAGRNADADAWLSTSPARELVVDGWIITERGIEVRGRGVVVPRQHFGRYIPGSNSVQGERISLLAPPGIDQAIYSEALVRAKPFMLGNPFPGRANDFAPRLPH